MTPTLLGRWETRLLLLGTIGIIITLIIGLVVKNFVLPFLLLGYVFLFGLVWDALYQFISTFRWDRDWPTTFQVGAGIAEGVVVWALVTYTGLPGVPARSIPFVVFISMYASIWVLTFIIAQGPLRIFLVRIRYQGGEWL